MTTLSQGSALSLQQDPVLDLPFEEGEVSSQGTSKAACPLTGLSASPPAQSEESLPEERTDNVAYLPPTLFTPDELCAGPSLPKKPNLSQVLMSVTPPPPPPGLITQSNKFFRVNKVAVGKEILPPIERRAPSSSDQVASLATPAPHSAEGQGARFTPLLQLLLYHHLLLPASSLSPSFQTQAGLLWLCDLPPLHNADHHHLPLLLLDSLVKRELTTPLQSGRPVFKDISLLDPDFVAGAVVKVEQVDMLCEMFQDHIKAVLGQFDNNSRLKRLNLGGIDVFKIPEKVLENAVEILRRNGGKLVVNQK